MMNFTEDISKCAKIVANVSDQMLLNISYTNTLYIQQINSFSNCHDRCVAYYCPFLTFGPLNTCGACWLLKKLIPFIYERPIYATNYQNCKSEVILIFIY
jgi:hypothetical protein